MVNLISADTFFNIGLGTATIVGSMTDYLEITQCATKLIALNWGIFFNIYTKDYTLNVFKDYKNTYIDLLYKVHISDCIIIVNPESIKNVTTYLQKEYASEQGKPIFDYTNNSFSGNTDIMMPNMDSNVRFKITNFIHKLS